MPDLHCPPLPPGRSLRAKFRLTIGLASATLAGLDLAVVTVSLPLAQRLVLGTWSVSALMGFVIVCAGLMQLDLFRSTGLYRPHALGSIRAQTTRLVLAWSAIPLLLMLLAQALGSGEELPPAVFQVWLMGVLTLLLPLHALAAGMVARARRHGLLVTRLVLVGAGPQAAHLLQHVRRHDPAVLVLGIYDDRRTRVPPMVEGCPVLGTLDDLVALVGREHVDQVVITLPQHAARRRLACFERLRHLSIDVRLSPDLPGLDVGPRGVVDLAGLPLLRVFDRPLAGWSWLVKAVEDRLLAVLVLAFIAPLLILLALLIRLDSAGPAIYRQQRFGFDNRPIGVFKFRTMFVDCCDQDGEMTPVRRGDKRVTRIGRFLRRTSLDELPQFLNVLRGEMSIVGPRPHATPQNEQFAALIDGYLARHRVKPGITGWAQVNGLRGEVDTLAKMQERVRYDLHYIENWSLQLDLQIILRTFLVGFSHPNAY